ncbi:MAG TPA: hypothetical protein VM282_03160 [Acidimicrobiales bacterium]|nr:hypothetical protein [Acidimicrobiales bacterium]
MSPIPTAGLVRALIALVVAVTFTAGCGSSEPKTQVLGEQEEQGASDEVVLLDPVCITNTPTLEPC